MRIKWLMFLAAFCISASAQNLKIEFSTLEVNTPELRIGDLWPEAGEHADFVLARCPLPGYVRTLHVTHLNALLKAENLPFVIEAPEKTLQIVRIKGSLPYEEMEQAVISSLKEQLPGEFGFAVEFKNGDFSLAEGLSSVELLNKPVLGHQMLDFTARDESGREY
ncbi:MAG: hypothetical protein PHQ23_10130, partial [Candidatus Wallbacteria bacterium]|nr:hypothetical protein [Candidatus Wallbacteria bacterium]